MPTVKQSMLWFKAEFGTAVENAVAGTPFNLSLVTAIAVQETGYIWRGLYEMYPVAEVLKVCVGDTIDAPGRKAFPRTKAELVAAPKGSQMFGIARQALVDVAKHNSSFAAIVKKYPDKFCRGYGILQYDLQFFDDTPDFFLKRKWETFDEVILTGVQELRAARARIKYHHKAVLTDDELIHVAIAYNKGSYDPKKGLKQGFKDKSGKYYGEYLNDYYRLAKTVS